MSLFEHWSPHVQTKPEPAQPQITCEVAKEIIARFAEASQSDVLSLRSHLAGCSVCSEVVAEARSSKASGLDDKGK